MPVVNVNSSVTVAGSCHISYKVDRDWVDFGFSSGDPNDFALGRHADALRTLIELGTRALRDIEAHRIPRGIV